LEFLQLRYFYETAKNENIAQTAEKFFVPASSVSASIKRLEKELNTQLFDRASNKIRLNSKGYVFAETIGEILRKLDETECEIKKISPPPAEINILIKAQRKWLTELIIQYKRTHPELQFRIYNDSRSKPLSDFDIIVDEQTDDYKSMERFLLSTEKLCIKASKNNPLVGKKLSFSQLREQSFVMTRKELGIRKLLENTGRRHGFYPNVTIECNDSYCITRYVAADMGLTLGSYRALKNELEKDIVPLDVTDFNEIQAVYVYHRKLNPKDSEISDFCKFLSLQSVS